MAVAPSIHSVNAALDDSLHLNHRWYLDTRSRCLECYHNTLICLKVINDIHELLGPQRSLLALLHPYCLCLDQLSFPRSTTP